MRAPLRIGVWFDESHIPYGGPSLVLVGTILGLYQQAEEYKTPILILLNKSGDVNWSIGLPTEYESVLAKIPNMWCGPLCLGHHDGEDTIIDTHPVWKHVRNVLFPSAWFRDFICSALPYKDRSQAKHRNYAVWAAGVDIDFFRPKAAPPTQDYFIYYKSQNFNDLHKLHNYLFNHWFGMKGTIITYYNYDANMLRNVANNSKFCIMLDSTETQGLAALEILATGCPMFVIDATIYKGERKATSATSVTCWNRCCGIKSEMSKLETDFPEFIKNLDSYDPRPFVDSYFSYKSSARNLLELLQS
jgi:hypothetical protein